MAAASFSRFLSRAQVQLHHQDSQHQDQQDHHGADPDLADHVHHRPVHGHPAPPAAAEAIKRAERGLGVAVFRAEEAALGVQSALAATRARRELAQQESCPTFASPPTSLPRAADATTQRADPDLVAAVLRAEKVTRHIFPALAAARVNMQLAGLEVNAAIESANPDATPTTPARGA